MCMSVCTCTMYVQWYCVCSVWLSLLYIQVGEVRLQAVHALIPLYSSTELAPHLELFTQKFKVSRKS